MAAVGECAEPLAIGLDESFDLLGCGRRYFACAPEQLPGLLTGSQCLETFAHAKGLPAIDADVLELATELRFDRYLDQFVDTYSLGTRQKLCVLLATHSLDIVEHYADKAALLIDGRIVREWTDAEIANLREQGANAFEAALASAAG